MRVLFKSGHYSRVGTNHRLYGIWIDMIHEMNLAALRTMLTIPIWKNITSACRLKFFSCLLLYWWMQMYVRIIALFESRSILGWGTNHSNWTIFVKGLDGGVNRVRTNPFRKPSSRTRLIIHVTTIYSCSRPGIRIFWRSWTLLLITTEFIQPEFLPN